LPARQKNLRPHGQSFKSCVILEGFAGRSAARQNERRLRKKLKIFRSERKKRATMQGFADRSGQATEVVGIFKNIQPISVGV
jgi:hypothetical protein